MIEVLGFVALGVLVGAVSSFFGIGGGVILVAALVTASDFGQQEAQATALAFMVPTAAIGVISTRVHGLGNVRQSALLGVSGAAAAVGGALLALELPADTLRDLFAAFMAIIGLTMLLGPGGAGEQEEQEGPA